MFNLNYIIIFYLDRFIAKILSDMCHKLINFVKPKGHTHRAGPRAVRKVRSHRAPHFGRPRADDKH